MIGVLHQPCHGRRARSSLLPCPPGLRKQPRHVSDGKVQEDRLAWYHRPYGWLRLLDHGHELRWLCLCLGLERRNSLLGYDWCLPNSDGFGH